MFADKTSARIAAIEADVPVVPGTDGPVTSAEEAVAFCKANGLPVIIKAAMGGGGKGMRVVREMDDLVPFFESASSEALASFGDGSVRARGTAGMGGGDGGAATPRAVISILPLTPRCVLLAGVHRALCGSTAPHRGPGHRRWQGRRRPLVGA